MNTWVSVSYSLRPPPVPSSPTRLPLWSVTPASFLLSVLVIVRYLSLRPTDTYTAMLPVLIGDMLHWRRRDDAAGRNEDELDYRDAPASRIKEGGVH